MPDITEKQMQSIRHRLDKICNDGGFYKAKWIPFDAPRDKSILRITTFEGRSIQFSGNLPQWVFDELFKLMFSKVNLTLKGGRNE